MTPKISRRSLAAPIAAAACMLLGALAAPSASADFGISSFTGGAFNQDGTSASQAGGHPYRASTTIEFPSAGPFQYEGNVKVIEADLPPGFSGSPLATPVHCTSAQLYANLGQIDECPISAQVGVAAVKSVLFPFKPLDMEPIYNMVPTPGSPALLGFRVFAVPAFLFPRLRTGGDYGITVRSPEIAQQLPITAVTIELWGVPADPSHDADRGKAFEAGVPSSGESYCAGRTEPACTNPAGYDPTPFLTNSGNCSAGALTTTARVTSWEHPDITDSASFDTDTNGNPIAVTGCNQLDFAPTIKANPTTDLADSPSGLEVDLHFPQNEDPDGFATAQLKDATVSLPAGLTVNPSSANGLGACSPAQIGLTTPVGQRVAHFTPDPADCPDAAKLGTVEVETPLIDHPLNGFVFLANQNDNPFGSLLAIYITINDPITGVVAKLPGEVVPDPKTGQLTATFAENPQLPFEDLHLSFFGEGRAALRTPSTCGSFMTTTRLTPWTTPEGGDATPSDTFAINRGAGGGACVSSEAVAPNAPAFSAGTLDPTAAAYSPFALKLSRVDGTQPFKAIDTTLPPGLIGKLAGISYCPEAALSVAVGKTGRAEQASASCPGASEVGAVNVGAGAGPAPLYVRGEAYLAGPYKGAPLSLAIVTPAVAGPFDLGVVVVRTALYVNPETTQIHAVSDPIPTILQGIPLDVRSIALQMDRPNFTLNPTSCDPMAITGSALSVFDQSAPLSSRFQVGDCARLAFKPELSIKLEGGVKRGDFPALTATLKAPPGNANIARTVVALPHSEFLAQSHIRTICTRVQFATDSCPAGSIYGKARAFSPLLDNPLEGSVYLRSSSHPLPDLVVALDGQIDVDLVGRIDSIRGGIRTSFEAVPDAPVTKFVLSMKGGKKGLLENSRNLCQTTNKAMVQMDAQNGKVRDFAAVVKSSCKKKHKKHRGKPDKKG